MDMARRSSRSYRTCQAQLTSQSSSSSSSRADKATRSSLKVDLPEKVAQSNCLSSEPLDESISIAEAQINMHARRKRGRTEEQKDKPTRNQLSQAYKSNSLDEDDEDDEAVRCICGLDDYPGPPQLVEENKSKTREIINDQFSVTDGTEDLAGFFLQCDICKVWQHGACVGIENEGSSPEEYFCECCRKDLHKIFTASNGQRYSHYLPLQQNFLRSCPRTGLSSKDETRSPQSNKNGRPPSCQNSISKKRSTMNSRDAAYDEEEQLRRAIEASKDEKAYETVDNAPRRAKRARSLSEERFNEAKGQQTNSASPSLSQEFNQISSRSVSDDGINERSAYGKKIRGHASKHVKLKDQRGEQGVAKFDSAGRRNERSDRKKIDVFGICKETEAQTQSFQSTSSDSTTTFSYNHPHDIHTNSHMKISDSINTNQNSLSMRRGGRPSNSRKGKLGRNQHSKDRDLIDRDDHLPLRYKSRDGSRMDENSFSTCNKRSAVEGRVSRLKTNANKLTMTDMKKRVAAILGFISRTQVEMANEAETLVPGGSDNFIIQELTESSTKPQGSEENKNNAVSLECGEVSYSSKDFKDLSCRDMMDVLTKQLIKWQNEFL